MNRVSPRPLSSFESRTGALLDRQRLGSGRTGFSASGIAADGKLYFPSEVGEVYVIRSGSEPEVLAVNDLGETCMATPAVSAGTLFFRTRRHLVAIAGDR